MKTELRELIFWIILIVSFIGCLCGAFAPPAWSQRAFGASGVLILIMILILGLKAFNQSV